MSCIVTILVLELSCYGSPVIACMLHESILSLLCMVHVYVLHHTEYCSTHASNYRVHCYVYYGLAVVSSYVGMAQKQDGSSNQCTCYYGLAVA